MILIATLSALLIYSIGVLLIWRCVRNYCAVDIGFIFLSLCSIYTLTPGFVFLFMDATVIPGWPWVELNKLMLSDNLIEKHLWRHNLFNVTFLVMYIIVRGRVNLIKFNQQLHKMKGFISNKEVFLLYLIYLWSILLVNNIVGDYDIYVEKYLIVENLDQNQKAIFAIFSRISTGIKYILVLSVVLLKINKVAKLFGLLFLMLIEINQSGGARIEIFFFVVAAAVAYSFFIKPIKLKVVYLLSFVGLILFMFVEVYRYYEFNLDLSIEHLRNYGVTPMGELGSVFFTGIHLYSLTEMGQVFNLDARFLFNEIIGVFTSNSNTEFSPQYWYWNEFYPEYSVPPQTNGPIADSALWGMGWIDLTIRASIFGLILAGLSRALFKNKLSFFTLTVYTYCCATTVMNLKYGIFWQLNPLIKTVIPLLLILNTCRYFMNGEAHEDDSIRF